MKNPFANILQNKKILWSVIIAIPLVIIVVILLLLNLNRDVETVTDSKKVLKEEQLAESKSIESSPEMVSALATEGLMLDREWALIALEKKALKEKEEEIQQSLKKIEAIYQQIEEQQKILNQQQGELENRNKEIQTEKQLVADEKNRLKLEWQELEIKKKEKEEQIKQESELQKSEESPEDKIAKERQWRKTAKGFETMRARDAADILINMLEDDREKVLNLLRIMDNRTRTRIISAISRERIDTAADLTKELMEIQ